MTSYKKKKHHRNHARNLISEQWKRINCHLTATKDENKSNYIWLIQQQGKMKYDVKTAIFYI